MPFSWQATRHTLNSALSPQPMATRLKASETSMKPSVGPTFGHPIWHSSTNRTSMTSVPTSVVDGDLVFFQRATKRQCPRSAGGNVCNPYTWGSDSRHRVVTSISYGAGDASGWEARAGRPCREGGLRCSSAALSPAQPSWCWSERVCWGSAPRSHNSEGPSPPCPRSGQLWSRARSPTSWWSTWKTSRSPPPSGQARRPPTSTGSCARRAS